MNISFSGSASKDFRKKAESAVHFYLKKLKVNKSVTKDISLNIHVCKIKHWNGFCRMVSQLEYEIHLDKNSHLLKTLAHEIVHMKQYLMGELHSGRTVLYWYGKRANTRIDPWDAYYDSPWEIEAYGKEIGLYRRWCTFYAKQTKPKRKKEKSN